jgi:cytochrome d ubiquinol oxidase subunit II
MPDLSPEVLGYLAACVALVGLMAYACLAGADFGGGVWDLLASGPRQRQQRAAIAHAMGPVWEANHVWLIFVLVVLFTCFPRGYAVLMEALFVPLHVLLFGIMLRGGAFVFRNYGPAPHSEHRRITHYSTWGLVFGVASVISPLLMGLSFGVVTAGGVRVTETGVVVDTRSWLRAYPIGCALLALLTCSYLAAVYLLVQTDGELREDFRRRAIVAGTAAAAAAAAVFGILHAEGHWMFDQLIKRGLPVLIAGGIAFGLSAVAVCRRWTRLARALAVAQTVLILLGWGLAHRDYLLYPDVSLAWAMAPPPTVRFMLIASAIGFVVLFAAGLLLFRVFESTDERMESAQEAPRESAGN